MNSLPSLKTALTASLFLLTLAGHSSATVILNDSFADGERVTQNLPNSAAWRVLMGGTYSAGVASGRLITTPSAISTFNPATTAYLTPSGTIALAVGESISFSFDARFSGVSGTNLNAFRFGIYNSGGSRQTGDLNLGAGDPLFNGYTGYSVFGGVGAFDATETVGVYERTATGSGSSIPVSAANNTSLLTTPYVAGTVAANTTTTFSFTLSRTASGLDYSINYGGITLSGSDASPVTTQFDTVSLFWLTQAGGAGSTASFDNLYVETVPEPSSIGLVVMAGALLAARRRYCAKLG